MTPTEIEAALRMLFAEVLAIPSVGRDDDFLALGGDSPMALQVDFEAETRFGFRCPPALLLEHPTAAALAPLLSESGGYEPLVPLRPAGGAARPALFCVHVHPGGGHALAYRHLAAAIDPGVPVWGLQAAGLLPGEAPHGTVDEMADAYVAAIRRVQPSGPYPLVGWSLGALVARAMAERLEAAGESVPVLAALDAPADGAPDRPSARSSASAAVEARLGALIRRRAIRKGFLRADAPAFWGEAILACLRRATAQAAAYRGGRIAAPTLLVRAMGEPGARLDDPAFDWRSATAGGVKILALGARHADLGDPEWAGAIAAALAPRLPG